MTPSPDARGQLRPLRQVLFLGLLFGCYLLVALGSEGLIYLDHLVEVWVDGSPMLAQKITVGTVGPTGSVSVGYIETRHEKDLIASHRISSPRYGLILAIAPDALDGLERITVRITPRTWTYQRSQFRSEWLPWDGPLPAGAEPGWMVRRFPGALSTTGSILPFLNGAINYEGDAALAKYVFLSPVFLLYALSFVLVLAARAVLPRKFPNAQAWLQQVFAGLTNPGVPAAGRDWVWLLAGLAVLTGVGVILEVREPCYFTQDDNFAQFLPQILYGCEALSAGVFPNWNPLQYLGAPLAEVGTYALTYPVTYLSYAAARFGLGNKYLTLEVFCWLHLLAGYLACFWLGRQLRLAAPLASALGLCLALSGFALIAGRSWYYMTPVFVWAPLLLVALLKLQSGPPTWRWTLGTGLVIGLFFHAGNAQMWLYALGFGALFGLWSCLARLMPWSRLLTALPAGLIGVGIAAVLVVPQLNATRDMKRVGGEGADISEGLLAVFIPYPMPIVAYPEIKRADTDPEHFAEFYYAGSVFSLVWLAALLAPAVYAGTGRILWRSPLLALSILALLLALGRVGGLWTFQSWLPILKQFNHPLKFLAFFHLFSCAIGALVLNQGLSQTAAPRRWSSVCFLVVAGLLLYHAWWARSALYLYGERPYPPLTEGLAELGQGGLQPPRFLPLTTERSHRTDYVAGLQHNFPTVYGLASIVGYDPIVEDGWVYQRVLGALRGNALKTARLHGVTHLVLHKEVADAVAGRDWASKEWLSIHRWNGPLIAYCAQRQPVLDTESIRVFELDGTAPLAFPANQEQRALPVRLVPSGVDVDVSGLGEDQDVIVNFLWRPGIRVYADGVLVPSRADFDQRIQVAVKAGTRQLAVRYESPWAKGGLLGGILIVCGCLGFGLVSLWKSRKS